MVDRRIAKAKGKGITIVREPTVPREKRNKTFACPNAWSVPRGITSVDEYCKKEKKENRKRGKKTPRCAAGIPPVMSEEGEMESAHNNFKARNASQPDPLNGCEW